MRDTTHEGNDPMGALTTHRGPLEACPAPECQDRVIEQQEDAEPTATVAGQSIALHVTGYPDVPNRWGSGYVRVASIRLDYGNHHTPNGRHAFVTGLWVRDDGEVTDAPVDRYYDARDGDMSDWPDWIADLARQHTPTEAQHATAHSCSNCEGVDPDTCLMNPRRPPEQCPRSEFDGYGLQCQKEAGHNLCTFEMPGYVSEGAE